MKWKCKRCRDTGRVPNWQDWDEYHGEPRPKPCLECTSKEKPVNIWKDLPREEWTALVEPDPLRGTQEVRFVYLTEEGRMFAMLKDSMVESVEEGEEIPVYLNLSTYGDMLDPRKMFRSVWIKETVWKKYGR